MELISQWAHEIQGPVVDAGCGPGLWTKFLYEHGIAVEGIDLVEEFIDSAASNFPDVTFRVGMMEALPVENASLAAVLAWYSVIHTPPRDVGTVLNEFARCIRPGGSLLLGFFDGERIERFDHAVVSAYYWPVPEMHRERTGSAIRMTPLLVGTRWAESPPQLGPCRNPAVPPRQDR